MQQGNVNVGDTVTVDALVISPEDTYGFFLVDTDLHNANGGKWAGVWVFNDSDVLTNVVTGDGVTVTGTVDEWLPSGDYGSRGDGTTTELVLAAATDVTVNTQSNALPLAVLVTIADLADDDTAESYEGSLISLADGIYAGELSYGEWSLEDSDGNALAVDDKFYDPDRSDWVEGSTSVEVTGLLDYSYGNFKLQVRDANDVAADVTTTR